MRNYSVFISVVALVAVAACGKSSGESEESKSTTKTSAAPAATSAKVTSAKAPSAKGPSAKLGASLAEAAGTYAVDSGHSQVVFKVKHMGVSHQYGLFTRVEGSFSINADKVSASTIDISIPTGSLFTAVKKRDDHLRSPDFFDVKQFPKATFKSKQIEATGANTYNATGDLTLHGVTKSVVIALTHGGAHADPKMMGGKFRSGFNGELVIKRGDFGMNYMQGPGLGNEVTLLIAIEGTRK